MEYGMIGEKLGHSFSPVIHKEFYIPEYRYKDFINTVNEKAKSLLNNKDLPKYLRKDIYLNSIIKKFYELRFACEQFGEELYKNTADEAFVFALKFLINQLILMPLEDAYSSMFIFSE